MTRSARKVFELFLGRSRPCPESVVEGCAPSRRAFNSVYNPESWETSDGLVSRFWFTVLLPLE